MNRKFYIYRGDDDSGEYVEYETKVDEGMVVLDTVLKIQEESAQDLGVRWNCKAGKCGSCSAEVNGNPKLMCMCRMDTLPENEPVVISPMKAFPIVKDLVCDVSWNFEQNRKIEPFTPAPNVEWKMYQHDVDRVQEFRKCIECYLCQNVCHVLRNHGKYDGFIGPRFMARTASLDMHPLDTVDRRSDLKERFGIGYCNITKCCTEVCPECIHITDNAIIPLKERVADRFFDRLRTLWARCRKFFSVE